MSIDKKLPINAVTLPYLEGLYQSAELTPGKKLDPLTPAQIQQARSAKALGDLPTTTTYQGDTVPDRRALAISLTHAAVKLGLDASFSLESSDSGYAMNSQIDRVRRDILSHYEALTKATPGKSLAEWTPVEVAAAQDSGVKPGEISKALTVEYLSMLAKGALPEAKEYRARFPAAMIAPPIEAERDALRVFADRLSWQNPIRTQRDLEVLDLLIDAGAMPSSKKASALEEAFFTAVGNADAAAIALLKPLVDLQTISLSRLSNAYAEGTGVLLAKWVETRSNEDFKQIEGRANIPDSTHSYRYMEAFEKLLKEGSLADAKRLDDAWASAAKGEPIQAMRSEHRRHAISEGLQNGLSTVAARLVQAFEQKDLVAANQARAELGVGIPWMDDLYNKTELLTRMAALVGYHPIFADATFEERIGQLKKIGPNVAWETLLPADKPVLVSGSKDLAPVLRNPEATLGYTTPELSALAGELLRRAPTQASAKELSALLKDIVAEAKKPGDSPALKTLQQTSRSDLRAALIELRGAVKPLVLIDLPQL